MTGTWRFRHLSWTNLTRNYTDAHRHRGCCGPGRSPVGRQPRADRQRIGVPITVLAAALDVPCQWLRRLEIGTRATTALAHITARSTA